MGPSTGTPHFHYYFLQPAVTSAVHPLYLPLRIFPTTCVGLFIIEKKTLVFSTFNGFIQNVCMNHVGELFHLKWQVFPRSIRWVNQRVTFVFPASNQLLASVHIERVTLHLHLWVTQLIYSHWATDIAINFTTKFATKFATKNELGLITIFTTKLSE